MKQSVATQPVAQPVAQPDVQLAAGPILVIEDESSVMAYVRTALERYGYAVMCSESAVEGLRLLETGQFAGIVSDMRTPGGLDGSDVHAWVVRNRPELTSRIVFITGDIANEDTASTLRETGAPCVEKPFRVRQFIDVVEKTMGKAL